MLRFEVRARVIVDGGTVSGNAGQLHVRGASGVTIVIAPATSFRRYDDVSGDPAAATVETLRRVEGKAVAELRTAHVADHQRLFRRVAIDLGHNAAAEALPTDARVRQSPQVDDPSLAALYFQFGRYLLISSSRPGTQPANLQGLWNDSLNPPWGSKYTININTQMNYWPAEVTNLAECAEPLFAMIRDLSETGGRLAREHYGAPGWVAHHNTDLWRATAPSHPARAARSRAHLPDLFDAHPPFQIDGNLGGTAGIAEMLLQSHVPAAIDLASGADSSVHEIELLPALPGAWPTGRINGLRARGGFEVTLAWTDGSLVSALLRATRDGRALLRYRDRTRELRLKAGETFTWDGR